MDCVHLTPPDPTRWEYTGFVVDVVVVACELESAASVLGKNNVDKGRISEMGVDTCYEGDLVMRSINIGICPSENTCDGVEETSGKNPSKSNGTDRHLETCSDRCSGISKDRVFVTSESKFVSEVENRNEPVPNVDNSMATESGGFVEVNNTAIEMRGFQIYPRLEVLITYSRKRRKNSSASASSLPSIMKDATSSLLITENKTTTPSSDHCQVSISYSNSLPAEVNDGGDTLLMGRQQMLLVKAAVDSPSSETWNKNEAAQVDNQKETVNSSMASIKDESPIDSKAENYEQERRNETYTFVNMPYDIEFAKGSSHYAMPSEDSPSHSRTIGFEGGRIQITNVGVIPPLGRAFNTRSSKKLLVLDMNGLLVDILPLYYVPYRLKPGHHYIRESRRNMELVLDFLLGDAKNKLLFCWLDVLGPSPGARAGHASVNFVSRASNCKLIIWFLLLEMLRPPLKLLFVNGWHNSMIFPKHQPEASKKVILGSYIQNFAKVSDAIRSFAYVITCSTQLKMLGLVLGVFAVFAAIVAISLYLFEPRTRQTFVGYLSVFSLISMFASPLFVIITNGLSKLFDAAGLGKFCFPVSRMPKNVGEWPTVADMVQQNQ
ncbi:hypothetical protein BC332_14769 [Capsicum chinense]|nr:hypothetical protein BC332_14769 [Capsicum chinense]